MMESQAPRSIQAAVPRNDAEELRRVSNEMEALFLRQLLRAMRTTVPESGLCEKSPGHDLFTELLDDQLANSAAEQMQKGIGEALYRQLMRRLDANGHQQRS